MALDVSFVIILLFIGVDLALCLKPKVPLLNMLIGVVSIIASLSTITVLDVVFELKMAVFLLMVTLTVMVEWTGFKYYNEQK